MRIKTFNNKYVYAYPTHSTDNSFLRTRCCGGKDAVGRKDVTVPGKRTTFLIHCQRVHNQNTVKFEILNSRNNNPSGYYFFADGGYRNQGIYAYKPSWHEGTLFNFIIKRWRGPVVAIRTFGASSNWLTFSDTGHGYVSFRNPFSDQNEFPSMADTYTLEAGICAHILLPLLLPSLYPAAFGTMKKLRALVLYSECKPIADIPA